MRALAIAFLAGSLVAGFPAAGQGPGTTGKAAGATNTCPRCGRAPGDSGAGCGRGMGARAQGRGAGWNGAGRQGGQRMGRAACPRFAPSQAGDAQGPTTSDKK